jgi:superfamily II DNA/RNA helicase
MLTSTTSTTTQQQQQQQQQDPKNNRRRAPHLGIIFCARIKTILYLSKLLLSSSAGKSASSSFPKHVILHGQLPPPVRERHWNEFRSGKCPILIATDVAARGMHVKHVAWIIQYDFPDTIEQYVHRCGRVGRTIPTHPFSQSPPDPVTTPSTTIQNTVYSFYTRPSRQQQQRLWGVTPSDLLQLLEATQQSYIDPNLRALVAADESSTADDAGLTTCVATSTRANTEDTCNDEDDDDDTTRSHEDPFPELSAHRVILQRASNMSNTSDSSSDDDDDDDDYNDHDDENKNAKNSSIYEDVHPL